MLKVNITNSHDVDEGLKLRKRQQYEDERKKRIFNAKQRLFGIDTDYIERQVHEKKKHHQIDTECQRRYDDNVRMMDKALIAKDREQETRQRMIDSDLNYYRCRYQRMDQRREFDLNDPNAMKKAKPLRIADDDINLGLASCQVFAGEDLGFRERRTRQFQQQRAWLDQQVKERKQAEQSKRVADELWRKSMLERDQQLEDMVVSEKRVRDQIIESVREFNETLARDRRIALKREKQDNMEDDMAEIYNMLTSDMLTENPSVSKARGMDEAQLKQFRSEQERQRTAAADRKVQAKLMDTQWEQYALNMDRELQLKDLELAEREKKIVNEMLEFNCKLAKEKQLEMREEERQLKAVGILDEFYEKLNTSTR